MKDITFQRLLELAVIKPDDPPVLHSIYAASLDNLDLSALDYLTIRDLLELTGIVHTRAHLLLLALFASLSGGNVCLELSPESLGPILGILDPEECDLHMAEIVKNPDFLGPLIHVADVDADHHRDSREFYRPLVLVHGKNSTFLYFQKYYEAERSLIRSLAARLRRTIPPLSNMVDLATAAKSVLEENPLVINGKPARLNDEQTAGIILPALRGLTLISGGPGTGKTFIALTMLRFMTRLGISADRIRLAAPTGRAAQRLTEAVQRGIGSIPSPDDCDASLTELRGMTLHRLLRYSPSTNGFLYHRRNRIPADLVIVDEASMIDITLLAALLEALGNDTRLVMMGDRNQLPSVEAGAVLADLTSTREAGLSPLIRETIHSIHPDVGLPPLSTGSPPASPSPVTDPLDDAVIILEQSYRSGKEIQAFASALQSGSHGMLKALREADVSGGLPERGAWRIEPGSLDPNPEKELGLLLTLWQERHYAADRSGTALESPEAPVHDDPDLISELLVSLERARILTPVTYGRSGTAGINAFLRERIGPRNDPSGSVDLYAGMPVMILRNDYTRELFNGDVGIILKKDDGNYFAAFGGFGGPTVHPIEVLPPFDTAYAITVHKSQGSEYGEALIIIPDATPEAMLSIELLYTAVTRAKNLVIIYANKPSLLRCAATRTRRISRITMIE